MAAPYPKQAAMNIGKRIRETREELGLSRTDLAKLTGIKYPTLAGIENGDQESTTQLHVIAEALGVRPGWLERGDGSKAWVAEPRPAYPIRLLPEWQLMATAVKVLQEHLAVRGEPASWIAEPALLEMAYQVVTAHDGGCEAADILEMAKTLAEKRREAE